MVLRFVALKPADEEGGGTSSLGKNEEFRMELVGSELCAGHGAGVPDGSAGCSREHRQA